MVNTVNQSPRVPQEASADDVAQLIETMDRASLALNHMSVSLCQDGTFVLNIPLGSFVVSPPQPHVSLGSFVMSPNTAPTSQASSSPAQSQPAVSQTVTPAVDLTTLNVGPTPEEVRERIADQDPSGSWYVVTRGLDVGVFKHLHEVSPLTSGVSGSSHRKVGTLTMAMDAYVLCWNAGGVRRL